MHEYEISIIIPTFNSSSTIERLIHSLLSQDFKDYEIIFIDDSSDDNTIELIKKSLKNENTAYQILANKENKGPGYARNVGIKHSRGKYIVFVDSDDIINFNHLSSMHKHMKKENIDSVFTKGIKIDDEDKLLDFKVERFDSLIQSAKENDGLIKSEDLIKLELEMKIPFSFVLLMYDKEIIMSNDLRFDENYRYGEDTTFAIKYLSKIDNVRVINKYTYFYYQNQESITQTISFKRFDSVKIFEDLIKDFNKVSNKNSSSNELKDKLIHSRIPRYIFGNMNYFFYNNYNKDEIFKKMEELDLFNKLKQFKIYEKRDIKFYLKIKLFLLNPNIYYKIWKKLKNRI